MRYNFDVVDRYEVAQWAVTKLTELEVLKKIAFGKTLNNLGIMINFEICENYLQKLITNSKDTYNVMKNEKKEILCVIEVFNNADKIEFFSLNICSFEDYEKMINYVKDEFKLRNLNVTGMKSIKPTRPQIIID